jgi:hypothetical protein
VLRDAYETTYGIHNHASASDDMALIRWRPSEDINVFDPTPERLKAYHACSVLKYTGITFERFLDLPRYRAEMYLISCQELLKEEIAAKEAEERRLKEEKDKLGIK